MKPPPHPFCDLWRFVPKGSESKGVEKILRFVAIAFIHYGWHACFIFRLSQWMHWLYLYPISFCLQRLLIHFFGLDIPPKTQVGKGLWLPHALNIVVHKKCIIGERVTILHNVTLGGKAYDGYPVIMDGVGLYVGCTVLGPVVIGERAQIGASSLVLTDIPPEAKAVGNPARILTCKGQVVEVFDIADI